MTEHVIGLIWDAWRARSSGAGAIAQRQRARLAEMVAYARANSPYYRELYDDLPERIESSELLPVTDKKTLLDRFDDWCVDRGITLERATAFAENPSLVGERFLGKYTLLTTSGTTGTRGVFVLGDRSMAVTNAMAFRMLMAWLSAEDFARILFGRGRMAMVMATGGHFASAVAAAPPAEEPRTTTRSAIGAHAFAGACGPAQPVPAGAPRSLREHGSASSE